MALQKKKLTQKAQKKMIKETLKRIGSASKRRNVKMPYFMLKAMSVTKMKIKQSHMLRRKKK